MAQTNDYDLIEKFLREQLHQLQQKLDQCAAELLSQSLSCPKVLSLPKVENRLQDFVRLHHMDLTRKINYLVNKFKSDIHEKQLFEKLSSYPLTNEQVSLLRHFILLHFFCVIYSRSILLIVLLKYD